MRDIGIFKQLLSEFEALPKVNSNPTFMDLCQLRGDRFEERCSRILSFYLDPNGQHRLKSLLLISLLEVIQYADAHFSPLATNVLTEDTTRDGKRIDITVISDSMVIAIENKIEAPLVNPLNSYVSHINMRYPDKELKLFIVLSVKRITDSAELQMMSHNGYIYVNYSSFFSAIKRNLGDFALDADPAYLTFLLDFIRTIENRFYNRNMELKKFFYENRKDINRLLWHYDNFKKEIHQLRKEQISQYLPLISAKTGVEWDVYQGWDLIFSFNVDKHRINIESSFRDGSFENPLGLFHIYISAWCKSHFLTYEQELKECFPDCFIDYDAEGGARVFLHVAVLSPDNREEIISTLTDTYNTLKRISDNHK